jgi:hypothetical protein
VNPASAFVNTPLQTVCVTVPDREQQHPCHCHVDLRGALSAKRAAGSRPHATPLPGKQHASADVLSCSLLLPFLYQLFALLHVQCCELSCRRGAFPLVLHQSSLGHGCLLQLPAAAQSHGVYLQHNTAQ